MFSCIKFYMCQSFHYSELHKHTLANFIITVDCLLTKSTSVPKFVRISNSVTELQELYGARLFVALQMCANSLCNLIQK